MFNKRGISVAVAVLNTMVSFGAEVASIREIDINRESAASYFRDWRAKRYTARACSTRRPNPLIKEYSLNHNMNP